MNKLKNIINILKKFFTENISVKLLSLIMAIAIWFIVVWSVDSNVNRTIKNVPIQIETESSMMKKFGLNIIDGNNLFATIYIQGNRNIVGLIDSDDIAATVSTADITEAGTYELEVRADVRNQMYKDIKFSGINPSVIKVKVDKLVTKTVPVEVICNGATAADGFILEKAVPSLDVITITGPERDVDKVDKALVVWNVNKTLSKTVKTAEDVVLISNNSLDIDKKYINIDNEIINVTLPVLKKKILPVTIDFINQPQGFPIEELKYTTEPDMIEVAGPEDDVDKKESINIAYVDIKQLDLKDEIEYDINIPSNFVNIENIEKVKIKFENENMSSKTFSNVAIKAPYSLVKHDIIINSKNLNDVKIVGDKNILSKLVSGDIVAEIEINDNKIVAGQMTVPVKISLPGKGLVWAVGDYKSVVTITDKS